MVSAFNRDLKITFWNSSTEKKFGIRQKDAVGKTYEELFSLKDDFRMKALSDAAEKGKSFYFPNLPYHRSTGSYSQLIIPVGKEVFIISCDVEHDSSVSRKDLYEAVSL